ncbi:MAG: 4-alpha-glucanotransferase [Myxococcales bacterium]|nr:4-alpha-glucanotransferase [Myxococcales bacterium]
MTPLAALAAAVGVDTAYVGWRGAPVSASPEALAAVLAALGHDVRNPDETRRAVERARWGEVVPPVLVAWDGVAVVVPARVPAEVDAAWRLELTTEGGADASADGHLFAAPARDHAWPAVMGGRVHCVRELRLAIPDGACGYHRLRWQIGQASGEALVIAAPMAAWGAPGTVPPRWGVFAPLHAVRTATSGQTGDLAVLRQLVAAVAARGGHYVATLPLLAAFLDEPCQESPYSPASRLYWNELYADVGAALPAATPGALVDYRAQYAAKRAQLATVAAAAWADPVQRVELEGAAHGALLDYALFRALGERARAPWSRWAPELQALAAPTALTDVAPDLLDGVRFHVWAQRHMSHQLLQIKKVAGGGGLYLDLPVGVNGDAYEVWRHRDRFVQELAAGAPPDALFLGGQDWGLPPLHPAHDRAAGYGYLRACVATHMRHASMLRIDHVMGLYRLYCVPRGFAATDGAYLRYRADELYAIFTLESHRHQCALAGEDLGIVPPEVRPALRRHGIARLYVGQFAMPGKVGQAMATPADDQVASLNTHDTPTFAGWWRGGDLDDQRDLGLIDDAARARGLAERAATRAALLGGVDDPSDVGAAAAMTACTRALAASPAHLVLVTVEDLWLERANQNVPGTSTERPNWRRPWARALEDVLADPAVNAALDAVAAARPGPDAAPRQR